MSDSNFTPTALPIIKNASLLRMKVLAMQVGDTMEVHPSEVPRSYKGLGTFIGNIKRTYGFYFLVLKLVGKPGWKITRVDNLVTLKTFSILPLKSKRMIENMPDRLYNMADAELSQLVDAKIIFAKRDIADLTARGITITRLNTLQTDNDAFKDLPDDDWWETEVSLKVKARNTSRSVLESKLGNLRTMAQNVYGAKSVEYGGYHFEGMLELEDEKLVSRARQIQKRASDEQAALLAEGCTATFLTDLLALVNDFDGKIDLVKETESNRHIAVKDRIEAGNAIYTEVDKICNTAKDVYREANAAKYKDYIIYNNASGSGSTQTREADVDAGTTQDIAINGDEGDITNATMVKFEVTGSTLDFYASLTKNGSPIGPVYTVPPSTVTIAPADLGPLLGFTGPGQFLTVRNMGSVTAHYKLTVTHLV